MSMRLMAATDDCHDGMASCTGMELGMLDGTGLSLAASWQAAAVSASAQAQAACTAHQLGITHGIHATNGNTRISTMTAFMSRAKRGSRLGNC